MEQLLLIPLFKKIVVFILLFAGIFFIVRKLTAKPEKEPLQKPVGNKEKREPQAKEQAAPKQKEADLTEQQSLRQHLREKERLESYVCYAKLFARFARPLQLLMGLDIAMAPETENEWLDSETVMDILQEDIALEMRSALRRAGGEIENGKIRLPLPAQEETMHSDASMDAMSEKALSARMHSLLLEIEELQIYQQRRALIEALTGVYEELQKLAKRDRCSHKAIRTLAEETEQILRRHGVFAMYYEDPRLTSALAGRFGTVTEQQLVYPGLFVQTQGEYRQLGHYSGTRRQK